MPPLEPGKFLFYYTIFTLLAVVFLLRRRSRRGMRLRLRGLRGPRESLSGSAGGVVGGAKSYTEIARELKRQHESAAAKFEEATSAESRDDTRSLNVMFNYNGHSWDAYEVLGLPAGASPENTEAAYKESLIRVDDASKPFIEAAYQAICSKPSSSVRRAGAG